MITLLLTPTVKSRRSIYFEVNKVSRTLMSHFTDDKITHIHEIPISGRGRSITLCVISHLVSGVKGETTIRFFLQLTFKMNVTPMGEFVSKLCCQVRLGPTPSINTSVNTKVN